MTRMRLTYDNNVVDPGVVTNYSESFQKSVTTFPIVTKSTDDTMAVESGSGRELLVTFERVHPRDHDDSSSDPSDWSNAKWYQSIQDAVDRWQTRTDGFIVDVIPGDDNPYVPKRTRLNGYVSNVNLSYKAGDNTRIIGRMGIATGRMWVQNKQPDPIEGENGDESLRKNHTILMSAPLNSNGDESWYLLYSFEDYIDCISSYTIKAFFLSLAIIESISAKILSSIVLVTILSISSLVITLLSYLYNFNFSNSFTTLS